MSKGSTNNLRHQSDSVPYELDGFKTSIRYQFHQLTFHEVRRGFEFSGDHSFYSAHGNRCGIHRRDESVFSIASISAYGLLTRC